jgi:hypothetical protein
MICFFKLTGWVNFSLQIGQTNFPSSLICFIVLRWLSTCIFFTWRLRTNFLSNDLPHSVQMQGFASGGTGTTSPASKFSTWLSSFCMTFASLSFSSSDESDFNSSKAASMSAASIWT